MNALIIYSHPNTKSFNHAILNQVKQGLKDGGHTFEVIDLYVDNFNPVLVYNEGIKRSELMNDVETAHYRELIKQADELIFIYPIWWYGMPAILKGFIDRVFVSGFAYTSDGKSPKGLLSNKSAWVIYTIDSPAWFVKLFRKNIEWKTMKDAILNYCGIKHVEKSMLAGVKKSDLNRRQKWLELIYHKACRI
ncbi:NAD(P)H-dependent oxidoreductase [Anoxybacterium hadale]|uniref:NAD(P)H-dependent oxidoreductase n=1 Tax=Anoxybacterium hadale TaxID=3408580 RepID=A0ACD1AI04_9FIRM|nr:NAD(P)H-dependent oxidoreductase [Clostridiales bacterium]